MQNIKHQLLLGFYNFRVITDSYLFIKYEEINTSYYITYTFLTRAQPIN